MYLGIEIGGTKLQLGVGRGDGSPMVALERLDVQLQEGAAGIRRQIETVGRRLIDQHGVRAIGIGFGGPVDPASGRTVKSHQVEGWDDFPLVDWCRQALGLPTVLANDSDSAGLAEALFGAGRGCTPVFYTNIGSGIGGALVIDGQLYGGSHGIASELGHLRPGLDADRPDRTLESIASGFGIAAAARSRVAQSPGDRAAAELLRRCDGQIDRLTGKTVTEAAADGNELAREVFARAIQAFGWAVGQMITLLSPRIVVVGGGVPLAGESQFFEPLRREVDRYVFPPLVGTFRIVGAALGEEVVVHGVLAAAARSVSKSREAIGS